MLSTKVINLGAVDDAAYVTFKNAMIGCALATERDGVVEKLVNMLKAYDLADRAEIRKRLLGYAGDDGTCGAAITEAFDTIARLEAVKTSWYMRPATWIAAGASLIVGGVAGALVFRRKCR